MSKKKKFIEDISYQAAANYLHKMKDPELKKIFSIFTGGTFDSKPIKKWMKNGENGKPFSGLMFWNCLEVNGLIPQFRIVMEPKFGFDYAAELKKNKDLSSWRPQSSNLIFPGQVFGENIYDLTLEQKLTKLKTHKLKKDKDDHHPTFDVNLEIQSFLSEPSLYLINRSPFSYFNVEDISRDFPPKKVNYFKMFFLDQGTFKHIRYYFGFDEAEETYHLRMILVPTLESGQNSVKYKKYDDNKVFDETTLLQKSWPPKPSNVV
jgi:hypothetical protein